MQYKNYLRKKCVLNRERKKAFFQKVHLEKGGHLIIRVVLDSGQYGNYLGYLSCEEGIV